MINFIEYSICTLLLSLEHVAASRFITSSLFKHHFYVRNNIVLEQHFYALQAIRGVIVSQIRAQQSGPRSSVLAFPPVARASICFLIGSEYRMVNHQYPDALWVEHRSHSEYTVYYLEWNAGAVAMLEIPSW